LNYLLDTDTCIFIRGRQPKTVARFEKLNTGDVGISVVTYGELAYGAAKSAESGRAMAGLERLIESLPILPMPKEVGQVYGSLRAGLEKRGEVIGPNDLWIAAHAIASGLVLVTNNEREFKRVKDLRIENWAK
jgi:tRNA(fMet)-specific endonuclease VapC